MKKMKRALFLISFLFFLLQGGWAGGEERFYVIVNSANPVSSMEAKDVSKLFLKKMTAWPTGQSVLPVDQPENSSAREQFSKEVHGKTAASLKAYWQQQIFSGRNIPPLEKSSDSEVIAYVKNNPNAIGYVLAQPAEGGIKVLKINR